LRTLCSERRNEKNKKLFPSDEIATEISSCIQRDLSQVPLFDRTRDSDLLDQLRSRQVAGTLKRYQRFSDYDRDALEQQAFDSFTEVNHRMGEVNSRLVDPNFWDTPISVVRGRVYTLHSVRLMSQYLLKQTLGTFWPGELHAMCKHGNGSTIGASYEDTSADRKFTYPMSCTREVQQLFEVHTRHNFTLCRAIEFLNRDIAYGEKYEVVSSSRGTTVDKTSSKRRMIAVEPTLNMFFQQGLMLLMYARLKDVGLDLESLPQRHRDLAREASIHRTYGTIDFSQASDSVAFELVRQLFPPDWFEYLNLVRTPCMEINGVEHRLNMFSTMGNATTFPLETLVFWAIACSCHHITRGDPGHLVSHKVKRVNSVFGDDCIVPTESCNLFIEVVKFFGFRVNEDKTFVDPNQSFRESCGGDYYHGYDVRPYSFKAPRNQRISELEPWLYTILNNILPIYTKYFGYWQSVLSMELGSLIQRLFSEYKLKLKLVPEDFPDDAGLRSSRYPSGRRPPLSYAVDLLTQLGFAISPIHRSESGLLDFSYVRFSYPKERKRNEFIRYAIKLYSMVERVEIESTRSAHDRLATHPLLLKAWLYRQSFLGEAGETEVFRFGLRRSPLRKKGGYVVSRTTSRFY
jgi:hypothetical protein